MPAGNRPRRGIYSPAPLDRDRNTFPSVIARMCSACREPKQVSGSRTFVIKGVRRFFCRGCAEKRAILANCKIEVFMKA